MSDAQHSIHCKPGGWIREEVRRAQKRVAQLPRWARPVVTRPVVESRRVARAGWGCYCACPRCVACKHCGGELCTGSA